MHGSLDRTMVSQSQRAVATLPPSRLRFTWRSAAIAIAGVACIAAVLVRYFTPVTVQTATARLASIPITVSGPGLVEAKTTMIVSARVQARVTRIKVDEGDNISVGEVLAELEQRDVEEQIRQARFDVEATAAAIVEAEQQLSSVSAALENARSDFDRKAELVKRGVSTQAQLDASRAAFEQALAQRHQAQASIEKGRAQRASAEAAVRVIERRLADGIVHAPIAGIVTLREKSVGDILVPGQPILEIVDPGSLVVSARFDESAMEAMGPNQSVEVRFVSAGTAVFKGRVLRLGRSVDTTTREFQVDVSLDRLPPHWAVGQRATVTVTTGTKDDVVSVPQGFVSASKGGQGVWIATASNRAVWRAIKTGQANGGRVEVTSGLSAGDIVVKGQELFQYARLAT